MIEREKGWIGYPERTWEFVWKSGFGIWDLEQGEEEDGTTGVEPCFGKKIFCFDGISMRETIAFHHSCTASIILSISGPCP